MRPRALATAAIMLTTFLAAMDTMAVGPAMPCVVAELGGVKLLFLVFSVYLVASTVMVPVWGRLSDAYGRLPFVIAGIVIFLVGSALCGLAWNLPSLILFRGLQGLGAGAVMILGFVMLADMYQLEKRAKLQGLLSSVWGLASIVGPIVGGIITKNLSWRYVFYINIPLGLIAIFLILSYRRFEPSRHKEHRLDLLGGGLFTLSMAALLAGFALASQREFSWLDWPVVGCLAGALVGIPATLLVERRHPEPFLPLELFRNRVFVSAGAIGFFAAICLFGISAYGPTFVQGVIGEDPQWAGLALTPLSLSWVVFSSASGFLLLRIGYRPLVFLGTTALTAAFALLLQLDAEASWAQVAVRFALVGCGMGCIMAPLLLAVQNSVPKRHLGSATSLTQFLRTIGGSLGLALMGVLFAARLAPLEARIGMPAEEAIDLKIRTMIAPEALAELQLALAESIHMVFLVGTAAAGIALLCTRLVPRGTARELAKPDKQDLV